MRNNFLPFSRPSISDSDIHSVTEILRSGWITTGQKNAEFEKAFCKYTGCTEAVALASATAGMHLLIKALDIRPGDEVITPAMTWVSTINIIALSGATPVFVDIDRDTLLVSPESVKKHLTEKTKMVVPVHFAGAPIDIVPLRQLCAEAGVFLAEDAAHAIGTKYMNERIGKKGTSIFSFHPIKNITTAEGGMFCSDNIELVARIRRLKFHGLGTDAYDRATQGRAPQAQVQEPGFKYNMTDISAALGLGQLQRLDEFNKKRTELAMRYREKLADIDEIIPLQDPLYDIKHAWHLFIVRIDTDKTGITRDEFMEELKKLNIGTGLHFRAVHLQKYYKESMGIQKGLLPNTEWNSDRICSLPLFPEMCNEDVDDVVNAIKEILKGRHI